MVFIKGNDSQGSVGGGNEPDDYRWQKEDGEYGPSVISGIGAANVFENIEPMTLNDVVCKFPSGKMCIVARKYDINIRRTITKTGIPTPIARSTIIA